MGQCTLLPFALLPVLFTRQQVKELAEAQGIKQKTALSWLYRQEQRGVLLRNEKEEFSRACTRV